MILGSSGSLRLPSRTELYTNIRDTTHVLQIKLLGDDSREPSSWTLFADGMCVADGSGAFARECFCEGAEVFLDLCRDAVRAAELHQWSQREYELLSAARGIAGV
ncbi:MAG: hypothetical protein SPK12_03265 [Collinsella sp.]|nr:hypothetical protein [Collinsella sp.]